MIASLSGKLTGFTDNRVTLDVGGVGFSVFVSTSTLEALRGKKEAILFTHLQVREDAFELYGFLTKEEQGFFEELLKVRDVGPKSALGILSAGSVSAMKQAIVNEDATALIRVSGIGPKTAERIILELKSKLKRESALGGRAVSQGDAAVIDALMNLGYSASEAREAIRHVAAEAKSEDERVKSALKALGRKR